MDLRVVGWAGMDWIDLALDRDRWQCQKYFIFCTVTLGLVVV